MRSGVPAVGAIGLVLGILLGASFCFFVLLLVLGLQEIRNTSVAM